MRFAALERFLGGFSRMLRTSALRWLHVELQLSGRTGKSHWTKLLLHARAYWEATAGRADSQEIAPSGSIPKIVDNWLKMPKHNRHRSSRPIPTRLYPRAVHRIAYEDEQCGFWDTVHFQSEGYRQVLQGLGWPWTQAWINQPNSPGAPVSRSRAGLSSHLEGPQCTALEVWQLIGERTISLRKEGYCEQLFWRR